MSNDVLALKYRPKFFSEVTGQDLVIETLSNSIELDKIHNAYLFSGTRGMGKTTIARLFAKSLLCHTGITSKPCGKCSACIEIDKGNHLDLIEIDAASRTKVEDTRTLMENVQYSPSSSRFKVYLIDEVHMLSTKSFNALLKTIEEPPAHVKFLMATTEPEKLPDTILSRCLHFKLASATNSVITKHLENILTQENVKYDSTSLDVIAENASGSIRDSLSIAEQCISFCNGNLEITKINSFLGEVDESIIKQIVVSIAKNNPSKIIESIEQLNVNSNFEKITDNIINILFRMYLYIINNDSIDKDDINYDFYKSIYRDFSLENLQLYYQIAISSKKDFKYSSSKKDYFSMIILRMILFSSTNQGKHDIIETSANGSSNSASKEDDKIESDSTHKSISNSLNKNEDEAMNWNKSIKELSLSGLTLHLARHSLLKGINSNEPILFINEAKKDIYPKSCVNDLLLKIKEYFEIQQEIKVDYSTDMLTPIIMEAMNNESELNDRYNKVKDDPDINKLQKAFGANINKESIKKIIE